jgi:hypothetical protein
MAVIAKTTPETETESKSPVRSPQLTGDRAIIWNPNLDPTCEKYPSIATPVRPFVMSYLDSTKTALTAVNPNGGTVPQFGSFTLKLTGVNWIKCEDWERAIAAGRHYGKDPEPITAGMDVIARLERSMQHGEDPVAVQLKAGAIVLPELLSTGQLKGTIEDYTFDGIKTMVDCTQELVQLEDWLRTIQVAIDTHPDKRKVVQYIERTIATRNGLR